MPSFPMLTGAARWRLAALLALVAGAAAYVWWPRKAPEPPRVAQARANKEAVIRELCADAGVRYPPREVFFRAFKEEKVLECWARSDQGPFKLLKVLFIQAASGRPGPKRREGDQQVPEGFYRVDRFNPESSFHLSLGLDYPNASDRILSDPDKPGFDIFIHGGAASVGCLALGDPAIEEVYLLATLAQKSGRPIEVHIFPANLASDRWAEFRAKHVANRPELDRFWKSLEEGFWYFEKNRALPQISVDEAGFYRSL